MLIPKPLNIFIGYDSREPVAFHVLSHSILSRASRPVQITALGLNHIRKIYTRERGATEATEFSMTRFLVPFLSGYVGYAMFMDCDMLCQVDICELSALIDEKAAVSCCHHDYIPKSALKMDGQVQTSYPMKNWSSLMVFDNARCRSLSPEYVNKASGLELHRFMWNEGLLGEIPIEWNWLVDEYEPNPNAKILHYTLGGPWFEQTKDCDHADLWLAEYAASGLNLIAR
jgi:hypothetical protein